jgi:succinoglycan biosynthesis protein ExoA
MISPYLAAVAAASLVTSRRLERREDAVHLPAAFVAMHVGWGVGFWRGLVMRRLSGLARRTTPD